LLTVVRNIETTSVIQKILDFSKYQLSAQLF